MQTITKNTNNTLIFTLEEKRTLTSPYYLVRVEGRSSRTVKRFILASEQSSYTDRYNKFTVTESTTEVLTSGTISLTSEVHDYRIYEQLSSTNLNEDASDNKVPLEYGLLKVLGTDNTYKYPSGEKEYKYPT